MESKVVTMWQIIEPDGKPNAFMTVQFDIAEKMCEQVEGRKMRQVAVPVSEEQYKEYLRHQKDE